MVRSKEAVARRLAEAHFTVEPGIERIVRLVAPPDREADPKEPVKLLEVNEESTSNGIVPVFFGPHMKSGIIYPSVIVEVTPPEYEDVVAGRLPLPNGWMLGEEMPRAAVAGRRDAI